MIARKATLLLLVLLTPPFSNAQGYFPLRAGNIWKFDYRENNNGIITDTMLTETVTGDTILSNGKSYAIYSGNTYPAKFMRQEGARVFMFDTSDATEYAFLDLAANEGDTTYFLAGGQACTWLFRVRIYNGVHNWVVDFRHGPIFQIWYLQDSLGMTMSNGAPPLFLRILKWALIDGVAWPQTSIDQQSKNLPRVAILYPSYPNPFNPSTTIRYDLPKESHVTLRVYNTLGEEVATLVNGLEEPGEKSVQWNATGIASGVYFYRLQAGEFAQTKKLLLTK